MQRRIGRHKKCIRVSPLPSVLSDNDRSRSRARLGAVTLKSQARFSRKLCLTSDCRVNTFGGTFGTSLGVSCLFGVPYSGVECQDCHNDSIFTPFSSHLKPPAVTCPEGSFDLLCLKTVYRCARVTQTSQLVARCCAQKTRNRSAKIAKSLLRTPPTVPCIASQSIRALLRHDATSEIFGESSIHSNF